MKKMRVHKKAPVTVKKRKRQIVEAGGCERCDEPRTEHVTAVGTWLPSTRHCGKCREFLTRMYRSGFTENEATFGMTDSL